MLLRVCALAIVLWFPNGVCASDVPVSGSLDRPLSLAGPWRFSTGDDPAWASPAFDDSDWRHITVPLTWVEQGYAGYAGVAWYRLRLKLDVDTDTLGDLAVFIGVVHSAYEIYANGKRLGSVGSLPPQPQALNDKMVTWRIPRSLIGEQKTLVVALRVWGGGTARNTWRGGAYGGDFLIGRYTDLAVRALYRDVATIVLIVLYFFIGLSHLYLFYRQPELKDYLWFGMLPIAIGAYMFTVSQWVHDVGLSFLMQKKLEFGIVYAQPALWIQTIASFLRVRIPPWLRVYQCSFLVLSFSIFASWSLHFYFLTLPFWQGWTFPVLVGGPAYVSWRAWQGSTEARMLWVGTVIFGATCINDILIDVLHIDTPHLVPYGFFAVIIFMMLSLANTFTNMYARMEIEVQARTRELSEANATLNRISITDPLTGVMNRRGFSERVAHEFSRATRTSSGCVLAIADIDHFKSFNDRYGHACGDYVLQQVAQLLGAHIRHHDLLGRWGGEEFILLLTDTSLEGARVAAEKLRRALESSTFRFEDIELRVTMTFGIAEANQVEVIESCLAAADRALYQGKEAGRNRVEVADPR
ncbi:MAG: diguanylate cyclase [Myxococcales bacterium]|nr:diguanylate cyclase [Myxococcales bacterium]